MARAFAFLYLGGGTFILSWLVLVHPAEANLTPIAVCIAASYAVGAFAASPLGQRAPRAAFELLLGGATALIAFGGIFDGLGVHQASPWLYLWAAPFAFWFFPLRRAFVQIALVAGAYALFLAVAGPGPASAPAWERGTEWAFMTATLLVVGLVVRGLASAVHAERRRSEQAIRKQALRDPLTGLPNRALLLERLDHALGASGSGDVALLFVDVDGFKSVNDSLGHAAGDELLRTLAPRIEEAAGERAMVARFGGDEFVVLFGGIGGADAARRAAERIAAAVAAPLRLYRETLRVSASIGIALAGEAAGAGALLRDADAAMYAAKRDGGIVIFDERLQAERLERNLLERDLRAALDAGQLELHYQPIVAAVDGRPVDVEALVRWRHPDRGLVSPAAFVPLAEETGLIVPIGRWVLQEACRAAARWTAAGLELGVSVNLAPRQLRDGDLVGAVVEALEAAGLAASLLTLEITESALVDESAATAATLERLGALGVRIVLDDFGSGYSCLGYLTRLPLHGLKLDRAFVAQLRDQPGATAIVTAVVELARALGLTLVTEGVETGEQLAVLRLLGVEAAQGYLFARPMGLAELERLLAAGEGERRAA